MRRIEREVWMVLRKDLKRLVDFMVIVLMLFVIRCGVLVEVLEVFWVKLISFFWRV